MIDERLIAEYAEMSAKGQFRGLTVVQYFPQIRALIKKTGAKTLLDYGSGRGDAWSMENAAHRLGLTHVQCYDPAVPIYTARPVGRFDGVVCCDVLEHVPEKHVDAVIADLFMFATKFVWASVCCRPAKKTFKDGTNLHVTVRPLSWWLAKFDAYSGRRWELVATP